MAGYGLNKEDHLSTVLQKNLNNNGLDVRIINASVSGDTTAGGLNRIKLDLIRKEYWYFGFGFRRKWYVKRYKAKRDKRKFRKNN